MITQNWIYRRLFPFCQTNRLFSRAGRVSFCTIFLHSGRVPTEPKRSPFNLFGLTRLTNWTNTSIPLPALQRWRQEDESRSWMDSTSESSNQVKVTCPRMNIKCFRIHCRRATLLVPMLDFASVQIESFSAKMGICRLAPYRRGMRMFPFRRRFLI